ncbi:MMPL family transporter [Methylovulum sp.]|uniref:MMPL family transporter n=1 Tax=Methylovulum sp. TaxID=1916980 RepID=UPI00262F7823|nr:MMPL family transporter [Methylovulum sp.]MDD5123917.1 MMPL family transporter [Methylovulum sp.]
MSFTSHSQDLLSRWGNWSVKNPLLVLLIVSVGVILAYFYTAKHLSINTDTTELVAPDAPFQQNSRKFEKAFPQDMRTLLLVVESATPELAKSATQRLGRLLEADKAHFESVYTPNDNGFFRKNGLLFLDIADLQDLSSTMSEAQPFIGRISQETHLSGFFSILDDAFVSSDENGKLPVDLPALISKVSLVLHQTMNGGTALLSWEELITSSKKITTKNGFIVVRPKFDYAQIRPAEEAINAVHKAVAGIQEADLPEVKVWLSGEVGLEDDELAGMSTGTFNASLFSVVVVLGILLVAYRSVFLTIATLVTLALGMVFCGAFAAAAVGELNLISVAFAVSNIGLGVEYAIHFCLRYRDNLARHIGKDRAIIGTLTSTSPSLLLCAGTTAIGLYAFIPTDYQGVSELGLLAGTSLFICLLVTLTVLPVMVKLMPLKTADKPDARQVLQIEHLPEKLALLTLHHAKPIALMVALLAVVSLFLMPQVETDFNPINLRDPNTESVIAFKALTQDKETTPMTLTVLVKDAEKAKALQQRLGKLASVDKTISLFDFQPGDQEEKLALIEEMDLTMGMQTCEFPALNMDNNPIPAIQHLLKTLDIILPKTSNPHELDVFSAFKSELQGLLREHEARLQPYRHSFLAKVQTALLGTLPQAMNGMLASFDAAEITLDDIPPDIKERWLSKEGWYRIQIFPRQDLNDLDNLEHFITDVQTLEPDATDLPILYWESMKAVVGAFEEAITIALVTIALVLFSIRRNLTDTLLIMTPLVLAGLFTMASTVLTHTPINFANIIALPLLLGFGVDNGIHMVEKLRHSVAEEQNMYQSSTARAMFYGALTTSSSFAGLAFSSHQGIASMGLVITIGIFWIMVSTFIILPAFSKLVLKNNKVNV